MINGYKFTANVLTRYVGLQQNVFKGQPKMDVTKFVNSHRLT